MTRNFEFTVSTLADNLAVEENTKEWLKCIKNDKKAMNNDIREIEKRLDYLIPLVVKVTTAACDSPELQVASAKLHSALGALYICSTAFDNNIKQGVEHYLDVRKAYFAVKAAEEHVDQLLTKITSLAWEYCEETPLNGDVKHAMTMLKTQFHPNFATEY